MKHPNDPDLELPDFHRAWEPAPPRQRKTVPTKRPRSSFRDPQAPKLDKRKHRRAVVKAALEAFVTNEQSKPHERAEARRLLGLIGRIERERPDTTDCRMMLLGKFMSVWVFEPELAPSQKGDIVITRNAALDRAYRTLRSM